MCPNAMSTPDKTNNAIASLSQSNHQHSWDYSFSDGMQTNMTSVRICLHVIILNFTQACDKTLPRMSIEAFQIFDLSNT